MQKRSAFRAGKGELNAQMKSPCCPVALRVRWHPIAAGLLLLGYVALIACTSSSGESGSTSENAASPTPAPRTGQEIFAATCATCHGVEGQGQPNWHITKEDGTLPAPPLNGDGHTWHHADGFLYRIVSQGGKIQEDPSVPDFKSGMPAFGEQLSHEEIIEVLTYVKSLWGDKTGRGMSIREWQAEVSATDPFPTDAR